MKQQRRFQTINHRPKSHVTCAAGIQNLHRVDQLQMTNDMLNRKQVIAGNWRLAITDYLCGVEIKLSLAYSGPNMSTQFFFTMYMSLKVTSMDS